METSLGHIAKCKSLAIMGGTFDPIHYGHLVTAEAVRDEFGIERVLFIPTGRPPHKTDKAVTGGDHRYLMTELATVNNPYFYTSRIEIDRPGATYTIETVTALRRICRGDATFYFITGADAVSEILTWKDAEELLRLCHFVAVTRPGHNSETLLHDVWAMNDQYKSRLHFLEVPALAISSSDIRNRVVMGKSIRYLLPEKVETYIIKHELYKPETYIQDAWHMTSGLEERLTRRRFDHTMGVAEEAVKLARHYGCSTEKAYMAALLHDCAKELGDDETTRLCEQFGVVQDDVMLAQPDLAHSFLGAEIAKARFGVADAEVLDAIRFHTTGRENMSLLEKIVFLADMIEPGRNRMPYLQDLTRAAYENIDEAVAAGLQHKITDCGRRGLFVHPLSEAALAYYKNKNDSVN